MAMATCSACKTDISPRAEACPKCGHPNDKKHLTALQCVSYIAITAALAWYFFGGGLQGQAANDLQKIHQQVANDSANQYEIAKRQGDKMQVCVQAGMVAAAYLQSKDEANYKQWKATEATDCKRAGVPVFKGTP